MNDYQIRMRLKSIVMECFVLDYRIFSNGTLSHAEKKDELLRAAHARGKIYGEEATGTRISNAITIIQAGAAPRALNIILGSGVGRGVKEQARALLKEMSRRSSINR